MKYGTSSVTPTPAQLRVLSAWRRLEDKLGYPPSVRQVAYEAGLSSHNSAYEHLFSLAEQGCLIHVPYRGFFSPRGCRSAA